MLNALDLHAVAQISAERMLNCVGEGIAIALFAWILLRLIGRRNSGTRFAVWFCALLAIALSPLIQFTGSHAADSLIPPTYTAITMPHSWALYLFAAWAAIAALGLARVALSLWHLRSVRRSCTVIELEGLDPLLRRTLDDFQSVRNIQLAVSDIVRVPAAIGLVKPAVVLPAWALDELSPAELNTILLHEFAHLRRWDDWTNLAQKILRALFFFHPAIWWIENRLSLEREMACDDLVLTQTANPRAYAECLVSLAEKNFLHRGIALAQAAVGRMRHTSQRILQILDARRPKGVHVWKPAPWVVGIFSVVCLVSSARTPRLVAFDEAAPLLTPQRASVASNATSFNATTFDRSPAATAHVIPASFVERVACKRGVKSQARLKATAVKQNSVPRSEPIGTTPPIVRTSAPATPEAIGARQAVFVIEEYGQSGPVMMWRISIWRISVGPEGSAHGGQEVTAKSI